MKETNEETINIDLYRWKITISGFDKVEPVTVGHTHKKTPQICFLRLVGKWFRSRTCC